MPPLYISQSEAAATKTMNRFTSEVAQQQVLMAKATTARDYRLLSTPAFKECHKVACSAKRRRLSACKLLSSPADSVKIADRGQGRDIELAEQSYWSIHLEGCELLISASSDGRLNLQDVYVRDEDTGIFARPAVAGELPKATKRFHMMEWAEEYSGDTLLGKPSSRKVFKVYLIHVEQREPFRLNLEEIYSFNHDTRTLVKEIVEWRTEVRDPTRTTLRIRPEGLIIEENSEVIDDWDLVEQYLVDQEKERIIKAESQKEYFQTPEEQDSGVPRDPIDALNDDEREYDESFEDTPEVDQGY